MIIERKLPVAVLSHIFCSLQWLAFRVESWEVILTWLHGWSQQECPSNLSLLSGVLECLGGCDGSISPGRRRRGELMSLAKAPRWEHTVLHGLKLLKTSGELSVQCHIYRLDCLWIFHRAATEMLLSDLLTSFSWLGNTELPHVSYLYIPWFPWTVHLM